MTTIDLDKLKLPLAEKVALLKKQVEQSKERIAVLEEVLGQQQCLSISRCAGAEPAVVVQFDKDFKLLEMNQGFADLTGYREQDIESGISIDKFFNEEALARFESSIATLDAGIIAEPFETALKRKDGSTRVVLTGLTRIGPGHSDLLAYLLDIHERVLLSEKLAFKENNLRALTSVIPQLLFVSDAEGNVIYGNESFYNYTGIDKDTDDPIVWTDLLHPSDNLSFSGAGFSVGEIYADFQSEVRLNNRDGDYKWHLLKVVPFFDGDRATLNWLTIATDIDEQRRVTDALMASEEQLRLIADALPQIVWTADASGNIDFWNHRWFEYTGLTAQQSLHGGWRLLIHTDDLPAYDQSWKAALAAAGAFEVRFRLKRVLGLGGRHRRSALRDREREIGRDYLWHLCRAVPVKDADGVVVRWFGTWTEIEEHKVLV
ncbi:MAG: PAS domain-containing protein [Candidatus Obscuribacter sp.]|nr:PAS domain-containing protein [Candidatus Obscuribacter sp.]